MQSRSNICSFSGSGAASNHSLRESESRNGEMTDKGNEKCLTRRKQLDRDRAREERRREGEGNTQSPAKGLEEDINTGGAGSTPRC